MADSVFVTVLLRLNSDSKIDIWQKQIHKVENKFVVKMNNAISDFIAEQERLNKEMSCSEISTCIAKARMGFNWLKKCLENAENVALEKSGAEDVALEKSRASREYLFEHSNDSGEPKLHEHFVRSFIVNSAM